MAAQQTESIIKYSRVVTGLISWLQDAYIIKRKNCGVGKIYSSAKNIILNIE